MQMQMQADADDARGAASSNSQGGPSDGLLLTLGLDDASVGLVPAAYGAGALPCTAAAGQDDSMLTLPNLALSMDEHDTGLGTIHDVDASDIRILSAMLAPADAPEGYCASDSDALASATSTTGEDDSASSCYLSQPGSHVSSPTSSMEGALGSSQRPAGCRKASCESGGSAATASSSPSSGGERQESDRKQRRRLQLVNSARRHRSRAKNERLKLKTEAQLLQQQLDALRTKHNFPRDNKTFEVWLDGAIVQRHKRRQAEELNLQLRQALFQQGRFLRGLRSFVNLSGPSELELNICSLLHSYMHLREDRTSRTRDLKAVCTSEKLDMAKRVVLAETESMLPSLTPNAVRKPLDLDDQSFGMTTVAVYAFNTLDAVKIFRAGYDASMHSSSEWPNYAQIESSMEVLKVPPMEQQADYGAWRQVFQRTGTDEQVAVEGRNLLFGYMTDSGGVYMWDFVDADDLHPLRKGTTVTRGTTGAFVVRREVCDDGVERVVCRAACSDIHRVEQAQLKLDMDRFTQTCNMSVYETIKEVSAH